MQNIPLVYGDSMLGSENWVRYRPMLQDGWRAEQEALGRAVGSQQSQTGLAEYVRMDEVE